MTSSPTDYRTQLSPFHFDTPDALAEALAAAVAADLQAAIAGHGHATLAVSGGTTPLRFFRALSAQPLDWARVTVTLVDERWVPDTHERSNARLVRQLLLQGPAAQARFLPLYRDSAEPEPVLAEITASLPARLDVVVLGMGTDGHTASFFPGGDHLAQALDPRGPDVLLPMRAAGAGEPRITLTLPALLAADHVYLHVEGAAKHQVLADATTGNGAGADYPMRTVLAHAARPLRVYWCP